MALGTASLLAVLTTLALVLAATVVAFRLGVARGTCPNHDPVPDTIAASIGHRLQGRESILSALIDGVFLFDAGGRMLYANPAGRDLLGRRPEAESELEPASLREAVAAARGEGNRKEAEVAVGARTLQVSAIPSADGSVVLVGRDVTTTRQLDRVRRDFVVNASHELKTPVASIVALVETLGTAAGSDPEAVARFIGLLEQEAVRLSRLVQSLLELSRLESDAPERVPVRLDRIVEGEAERLRWRAEAGSLRLLVETPVPIEVSGSPTDIGLLVHNLVDNAIRYSPNGREIRVMLETRDGFAVLRVSDTGIGIPTRDLERIFERFYRADSARSRETGGTGLGLAIVRHVAEAHGGSVAVRSVLGAGSTFIVRLPLSGAGQSEGSGPPAPEHLLEARPG